MAETITGTGIDAPETDSGTVIADGAAQYLEDREILATLGLPKDQQHARLAEAVFRFLNADPIISRRPLDRSDPGAS